MKQFIISVITVFLLGFSAIGWGGRTGCLYYTPGAKPMPTTPYNDHIFVMDDGTAIDTRPQSHRSICNCCPGGPQNIVKITREPNGGGYGGWITKVTCRPYTYTNTNTITVRCPCHQ